MLKCGFLYTAGAPVKASLEGEGVDQDVLLFVLLSRGPFLDPVRARASSEGKVSARQRSS